MNDTVWYRIDAPTWKARPVFAVVVRNNVVIDCAPYVRRTAMGRSWSRIREEWERNGAVITRLKDVEA